MRGLERIDRFEVVETLGVGSFATVLLARDPVLGLEVAIKVLADNLSHNREIRERFISEARVLWQTNSPRIIRVHHVGELDDGRPFFVMALANRGTLLDRIKAKEQTGATFAVAEVCGIAAELARAIADVHDTGRIHRDIKPGNVLISTTDTRTATTTPGLQNDERLVLGDFGLARSIDASAFTFVSGTPTYVAPEQAQGLTQLTEQVDLYPIGIIAIELLTGSLPTDPRTMRDAATSRTVDVAEHLNKSGVQAPPDLTGLLQKLISPDPDNRPATALHVADAFDRAATTPSEPIAEPVVQHEPMSGRSRSTVIGAVVAGIAGLSILAAGAAAVLISRDNGSASIQSQTETEVTGLDTSLEPSDDSSSTTVQGQAAEASTAVIFPLPAIAATTASDGTMIIAVVAASVEDMIDFYQTGTASGWAAGPVTMAGNTATFKLTNNAAAAEVTLSPTAQGAGNDITEIRATYISRP